MSGHKTVFSLGYSTCKKLYATAAIVGATPAQIAAIHRLEYFEADRSDVILLFGLAQAAKLDWFELFPEIDWPYEARLHQNRS